MLRRSLLVAFSVAVLAVAAGFVCPNRQAPPAAPPLPAPPAPKPAVTVFQVGKGKAYHLETCKFCWKDDDFVGDPFDLDEAVEAGLKPCKVCKPPVLNAAVPTISGTVVGVHDGDTITLLDAAKVQHKIRLEGIDAPELDQPFGMKAKQALSAKVFGVAVTIALNGKDKYGRDLGHIYLGTRWINLEMVAGGFAWHYKKYSKDQRLAEAEDDAHALGLGLWADEDPMAPWDYRALQKAKAKAKKLGDLPHVQRAEAKYAVAGATTTIVQVCDWHLIGAEAFVADENDRNGESLDAEELEKLYAKHLDDVQAVQREEVELLTAILNGYKVTAVFQEGLTADNLKEYKLLSDVLAKHESDPKYREAILRHGATAQLFRSGKIKEVLPLDDASAWKAANPVKPDGSVQFDKKAVAKREDAQVAALLKQTGIAVVVLGGAHDLTESLRRAGAKAAYLRVEVAAYRKLAK